MKLTISIIAILVIIGCSTTETINRTGNEIIFHLDISQPENDLFLVTAYPPDLGENNNIYNFVSTAPGVYTVLDIGRLVKSFKAFDEAGDEINTEQISTNKWELSVPGQVYKIEYTIEDSYDAGLMEHQIPPMGGTGIEEEYVHMNTFGVFGYFEGLQSNPVKLKVEYPEEWIVGTALSADEFGYYGADTYDHFADSPFLIGELSIASKQVNGIEVDVYVHSLFPDMGAEKMMGLASDVLDAAGSFISYDPVDRYVFLMTLVDMDVAQRNGFYGFGALEHSYSSNFVYPGYPQVIESLRGSMAHEFFHIMTPLNLHSEIIAVYDFAEPTASEHLWLYEGVTEWASDIMQFRGGVIGEEEYFDMVSQKISEFYSRYDTTYSLSELSLNCYTDKGRNEFPNVYAKGSLVASMLDIELLKLSNGRRGLREVFVDLTRKYGKNNPFPEKDFFNVLVNETYPEIDDFIDKYIRSAEPMPLSEYYSQIGYMYTKRRIDEENPTMIGLAFIPNDKGEIVIDGFADGYEDYGLERGDALLKLFGEEVSFDNARSLIDRTKSMKIGDEFSITVKRDGEELEFTGKLFQRYRRHLFDPKEELTDSESKIRNAWKINM
jgi:predicted metalloprotease with PDZ domain